MHPLNSEARKHRLVSVYEAANDTLREIYIGTSDRLIEGIAEDFRRHPPASAAHWNADHRVHFRCVEYAISADDAPSFIKNYAGSGALSGWKVIR